MLFWLFVIVMVIFSGIWVLGHIDWYNIKEKRRKAKKSIKFVEYMYKKDDLFKDVGCLTTVISIVVVLIMLVVVIAGHVDTEAKVKQNIERYNALNYKVTSGACRDELGLLSKSVIDEIQDWNEDVIYYQTVQDNFWIGIFYPNVFDQFETIDYENYNAKNQEFIYGVME